MSVFLIIAWILAALIIPPAIYAVETKDLLSAAIAVGFADLVAAIVFLLLQAPDVAITQAAIGAGITLAIFVYAIQRTERWEK
ncbi:MAG: DUF4040 domain-containing protein [Euryarchaeota archaeon]|nr:DUF4040 domain-containing protein [Euryarchaeota archaeon]